MATTRYSSSGDLRRQVGSPRAKGRDNKDTLCRNILIYGHCRYEDQGCTFNHEQHKNSSSQTDFTSKKSFNADTPSFTPTTIQQQQQQPAKKSTFSSQAASAAPFTPRGVSSSPALQQNTDASVFNPAQIREFTPQNYDLGNTTTSNGAAQDNGAYNDPFMTMSSMGQAITPGAPFNPYAAADPNALPGSGSAFYPQQFTAGPLQPLNYHLYNPYGSEKLEMLPYQRSTYDFFIPDKLREEMQKKMHATQLTMPNSVLPQLEHWHSLFPLDTSNRKSTSSFNYASWMYKAKNSRNGRHYALRRLEGYRLTNDTAIINALSAWKNIASASIVTLHEIFTTREFGDSSLIFAYDYHPLSKTLQEQYFPAHQPNRYRPPVQQLSEQVLWGYICQITNALQAIHSAGQAARCIELSKIIITDKNRIRLAACAILDIVQFDTEMRPIRELQLEDLAKFGRVMLCLASNTPHLTNIQTTLESLTKKFSAHFKDAVAWLISPPTSTDGTKSIDSFIGGISSHMSKYFDSSLHDNDEMRHILGKELENGRYVRLMLKLATINERGDLGGIPNWSETGDRYQLKLFRDYVFHQVEADGKPRLDIGHMLSCLNKLDCGYDEQVMLTSQDNDTMFVLTYRELKLMFERAFNELVKQSKYGALHANS